MPAISTILVESLPASYSTLICGITLAGEIFHNLFSHRNVLYIICLLTSYSMGQIPPQLFSSDFLLLTSFYLHFLWLDDFMTIDLIRLSVRGIWEEGKSKPIVYSQNHIPAYRGQYNQIVSPKIENYIYSAYGN